MTGNEAAPPSAVGQPQQVGPYRILAPLGEGGMGTVYLAEQSAPVKRRVALKLIKLGMDSKAVVARFEQERQALALMDHAGIAKVHDCGTSERGQPFFVMELVQGIPLTKYCDERRLSLRDRLVLVQQVCAAVQHAHQKGVVHRDLKPGNVLVADDGGKPQVKIIDFGLAKAMGQKLVEATLFTEAGQVVGTPEYMAPEQADPSNQDIDTRADVYSLGVLLYEVLTGQLPFAAPQLRQAGLLEMQRVLKEVEPPKPSTKLSSIGDSAAAVAGQRRLSAPALLKALRSDLDWLVLKALEKDRNRRYETANALSMDLQRYLDHEPLVAGPPSAGYRLKKLVRRYRAQVVTGAMVLLALVAGGIGTFVQWREARANEVLANQRAEENRKLAESESAAKGAALAEKERADGKVREFDQLAGVVLYERAIANEELLWPPWPQQVEAMERWLREDAGKLLQMRPEIERTVRDLEARALPATAEEIEAERRAHPRFTEWELLDKQVASLRRAQAIRAGAPLVVAELSAEQRALDASALNTLAWERVAPKAEERRVWGEEPLGLAAARLAVEKAKDTDLEHQVRDTLAWALVANGQDEEARLQSEVALDAAPSAEAEAYGRHLAAVMAATADPAGALRATEARLLELGAAIAQRRTWRFELESQRFLHDTLVELLGKLGSLAAKQKADVEQRLSWARRIGELSRAHPNARHTWSAVRTAVAASPKYAGQTIELREQDITGLVPIGANPVTGLWEFYELRSAWDGTSDPAAIPIPEHEPDGSIEVTGATGIVFVLLPGGTVTLGSQSEDADAPFYDAQRQSDETLHEVTLSPFLLARHELTQGQWARLWTWDAELRDPSQSKAGATNHAGGRITAANPVELVDWPMCDRLLSRYGMVLPTEAQWEYGCRGETTTAWSVVFEELGKVANVADAAAQRAAPQWGAFESWRDGHVVHAPVGSFAANGFGLHDVHGNVWEWCRDWYGAYGSERAGDGQRSGRGSSHRVDRGGSFNNPARHARSALRSHIAPSFRNLDLGLRPARLIPY